MANAGWYNDRDNAELARWHDGVQWTEHTIQKADWVGQEPPPPQVTHSVAHQSRQPPRRPSPLRIVVPLLAVAVLGIAFVATRGGDDGDADSISSGDELPADEATDGPASAPVVEEPIEETTTTLPSAELTQDYTDSRGYTTVLRVSGIELREDIADAPPGFKTISADGGRMVLQNTTPDRIAPAPQSFTVVVAFPSEECAGGATYAGARAGYKCEGDFGVMLFQWIAVVGPDSIPKVPVDGSLEYVLHGTQSRWTIEESYSSGQFYWTVDFTGKSGMQPFEAGWASHGLPASGAPVGFDTGT